MNFLNSICDRTASLADVASDRLNPILVKETRQATQGKIFATIFLLFVGFSWLVLVLGIVTMWGSLETRATAEIFFGWNFAMLSFAILVVVPFGCFRSLLAERELHTYDLLRITSLTPRQIVWGKLATSLLQVVVYYSAIAPFIAFTSFLQGFDVVWISWVLAMSFLWSMVLCVAALLAGVATRSNQWQSANMVGLIIMLLILWGIVLAVALEGRRAVEFDDPDFWWVNLIVLLIAASYVVLAGQLIVARLTFASGNRSSGIRIVLVIQFWLALLVTGVLAVLDQRVVFDRNFQTAMTIWLQLHWIAAGLVLVTESDFLSRRIRGRLPVNRFRRFLVAPFLPGGATGTVLVFGHLMVIGVGVLIQGFVVANTRGFRFDFLPLCVILLNGFIWIGIASALGRWCRKLSYRFTPATVRILTISLFAFVVIVSLVPALISTELGRRMVWLGALSPFVMIEAAVRPDRFPPTAYASAWIMLIFAAATVFAINVRAMYTGVARIVRDTGPVVQRESTPEIPQPHEASFDA